MKSFKQSLALAAVVLSLGVSSTSLMAQGRGNFDPEQMRQRMMDRYKEMLDVKSDDEWKVIQDRVEKVTAARRDLGAFGGGFGGFGGFGGGRGGQRPAADAAAPAAGGDQQANRRRGPELAPEAEGLQKAIDGKASADEIKTKLAALRVARKEKEDKLEKAQDDLRKVLSGKQEAAAVLAGLLK